MLVLAPPEAQADCAAANDLVGPHTRSTWVQGGLVYDLTNDELKTCDGTNWNSLAAGGGGLAGGMAGYLGVWSGATALGLSGTGAGQQLFWDSANHRLGIGTVSPVAKLHVDGGVIIRRGSFHFICGVDTGGWRMIETSSATTSGSTGYFVATDATNGALGGLAGANSLCLSRLLNSKWIGKDSAAFRNLLVSSKVRAFLCDSTNCNDLAPNATYTFSMMGNLAFGGGTFTTDAAGLGPNDNNNWMHVTRFCWAMDGYGGCLGVSAWTGRGTGTNTLWPSTPHANTCTNWTSSAGGVTARIGNGVTGTNRWSSANGACNQNRPLICIVDP